MGDRIQNRYHPDVVTCPGESLAEILEAAGMSQAELARRTGRPTKTINGIIKGREALTPETSLQLEKVLGVKASFWNNLESNYREYLARKREMSTLSVYTDWLRELPIKVMRERGWIPDFKAKVDLVRAALEFFQVASVEEWRRVYLEPQVSYRRSQTSISNPGAIATWLRAGEINASDINCAPYDAVKFMSVLAELRPYTKEEPETFQPQMEDLCARAGVAVCFVREIKGAPISGATRWQNPRKAILQLSLRYKTNDHLWFSFYHEAGHILLHGKKDVFLEMNGNEDSRKEDEADSFAGDFLIPANQYREIIGFGRYSHQLVQDFARRVGVHPGIVVGRLQHDGYLEYTHLNSLKMRLKWKAEPN